MREILIGFVLVFDGNSVLGLWRHNVAKEHRWIDCWSLEHDQPPSAQP